MSRSTSTRSRGLASLVASRAGPTAGARAWWPAPSGGRCWRRRRWCRARPRCRPQAGQHVAEDERGALAGAAAPGRRRAPRARRSRGRPRPCRAGRRRLRSPRPAARARPRTTAPRRSARRPPRQARVLARSRSRHTLVAMRYSQVRTAASPANVARPARPAGRSPGPRPRPRGAIRACDDSGRTGHGGSAVRRSRPRPPPPSSPPRAWFRRYGRERLGRRSNSAKLNQTDRGPRVPCLGGRARQPDRPDGTDRRDLPAAPRRHPRRTAAARRRPSADPRDGAAPERVAHHGHGGLRPADGRGLRADPHRGRHVRQPTGPPASGPGDAGQGCAAAAAGVGHDPGPTAFARPAELDFRTGLTDSSSFNYETWRRLTARELQASVVGKAIPGDPAGTRPCARRSPATSARRAASRPVPRR